MEQVPLWGLLGLHVWPSRPSRMIKYDNRRPGAPLFACQTSRSRFVPIAQRYYPAACAAAMQEFLATQATRVARGRGLRAARAAAAAGDGEDEDGGGDVLVGCQLCGSPDCHATYPDEVIRDMFAVCAAPLRPATLLALREVSPCRAFWGWWDACTEVAMWRAVVQDPEVLGILLAWFSWRTVRRMVAAGTHLEIAAILLGQRGDSAMHLFLPLTPQTPPVLRPYTYSNPADAVEAVARADLVEVLRSANLARSQVAGVDGTRWVRVVASFGVAQTENRILHTTARTVNEDGNIALPL
jgi:hypothetical protein